MTDFERKRFLYMIKAAEHGDWIRMGKQDAEVFEELLEMYDEDMDMYNQGYTDGYAQVLSLPEASDIDLEKIGFK